MAAMTEKQEALILRLARQLDGGAYRYVHQAEHLLPLSRTAIRKGMTMTDASLCIDHLKSEIEHKEEVAAQPTMEGAPEPADVLAMLGRDVIVTTPNGERSGKVTSIIPSNIDGTPALTIGPNTCRVSVISAWKIA